MTWFSRDSSADSEDRFVLRTIEKDYFDAMAELGLHNSSVLLANHMIWVEGPSDVLYLRALLKLHPDAQNAGLREDLDYAFFMYGGALLDHYEFGQGADEASVGLRAASAANRIVLVMDRDSNDPEHAKTRLKDALMSAAAAAQKRLRCLTTNGWEIENELGPDIWNKVLKAYFDDLDPASVSIADDDRTLRLGTAVQNASKRWRKPDGTPVSQSRSFVAAKPAKNAADPSKDPKPEREGGSTLASAWKQKFSRTFSSLVNSGEVTWEHLSNTAIAKLAGDIVDSIVVAKT